MTINDRVNRLERQNRWLRGGVAACVAVAGIAAVMGADNRDRDLGPYKTITAQELLIVNEKGKRLVRLSADSGGGMIQVSGPDQKRLATIFTNKGGASFLLADKVSKKEVYLTADRKHAECTVVD